MEVIHKKPLGRVPSGRFTDSSQKISCGYLHPSHRVCELREPRQRECASREWRKYTQDDRVELSGDE